MATCDTKLEAIWRDTPNYQPRRNGLTPTILLMHYTGLETADEAADILCDGRSSVSCHYLLDEAGHITQMVPESERAWHAGLSHWAGEDDVNSCSIGIEVVNPGHDLGYPDFPQAQIDRLIELSNDIIARYGIEPQNVLGHSDVAPRRKKDPGEKFPWKILHEAGIGHWVEPAPLLPDDVSLGLRDKGEAVAKAQQMLTDYGYLVGVNGKYGKETAAVVTAFQRHFRPEKVDGKVDTSTRQTLEKLLAALSG